VLSDTEGLGIISTDDAAFLGLPVRIYTLRGAVIGHFIQPDLSDLLSVSPDGGWVAWCARSTLGYPFDGSTRDSSSPEARPTAIVTNGIGRPGTLSLIGGFPADLALSYDGLTIGLLTRPNMRQSKRLFRLDVMTGQSQEFTRMVDEQHLRETEWVKISEAGKYLIAAARTRFEVVGAMIPRAKIEPSPDGQTIAYINADHRLMIYSLRDGLSATLLSDIRVDGVGAWSPNGKLVLAGIRRTPFSDRTLVVIDVAKRSTLDVINLGDHLGERFGWINTRFASER